MFVSVYVKMGLSRSLLRVDFSLYRAQAKTLKVSSSEMEELKVDQTTEMYFLLSDPLI